MQSNAQPHRKAFAGRWAAPAVALVILSAAALYTALMRGRPGTPPPDDGMPPRPGASSGALAGEPARITAKATVPTSAPPGRELRPLTRPLPGEAAPPPAPDTGIEETRRDAIQKAARSYREGRFNVFFREEAFIQELANHGVENVAALQDALADTRSLSALPDDTRFTEQRPETVLDRMAMIDLLHTLAPEDDSARAAMLALATSPIDPSLSDVAKKGLVGEKYDLFFKLAQIDRQAAVDAFGRLDNPKLRSLLREALLAGLHESGASYEEVQRLTRHL
ncbi:hypothetical protein MXAN_5441 [Myxococcus xanthus DK 1622]|uniref:Uncharacterized protein n=1 Tax=Myxococcus xanthus (strain DK1622) TaxID=246197 RepID=Q1D189_MYXXD|nr:MULTISPECIES: hypothetical protein [Myxococcus]ABF86962.1 hypothetical protein MXAN_5441 [Myxococcus xanthus DK 1622]QZZ53089.1 hypothetical protein MyxoNM_28140 [Myxococcus xanthus]UYI12778.1 hypothetical protein N3T43_27465 [Myxococcus xanthus]UYI20144.1 hypothetical protein N1129_27915 [Myxococcus xanthus]SDX17705.1 hypothetical protein SAMN05444383_105446 [Myxococcus xanthus]